MSGVTNSGSVQSTGGFFTMDGVTNTDGTPKKLTFTGLMLQLGLDALEQSRGAFAAQFELAQALVKQMEELNNIVQQVNALKNLFPDDENVKSDSLITEWVQSGFYDPDEGTSVNPDDEEYNPKNLNYEVVYPNKITLLYRAIEDFNKKYPDSEIQIPENSFFRTPDEQHLKDTDEDGNVVYERHQGTDLQRLLRMLIKDGSIPYEEYHSEDTFGDEGTYGTSTESGAYVNSQDDPTFVTKGGLDSLASNMQALQSTIASENEQQGTRTNQAMNYSSGHLQQLQTMMQAAIEARNSAARTGGA